jgi:hypothetical protein
MFIPSASLRQVALDLIPREILQDTDGAMLQSLRRTRHKVAAHEAVLKKTAPWSMVATEQMGPTKMTKIWQKG